MSALVQPTRAKDAKVWARDELDFYVEPEWATAALLGVERFVGGVWDPACGQGNIVRACRAAGYETVGTDVVRRTNEPWFAEERDFRDEEQTWVWADNIITNPPFFRAKGTEAFARRALALAKGKVAIFADIRFLASGRRARGLYAEHPPHRIWVLADRPSCPPGEFLAAGNEAGGGTADWCWLVWDQTAPHHGTTFGWLTGRPDRVAA